MTLAPDNSKLLSVAAVGLSAVLGFYTPAAASNLFSVELDLADPSESGSPNTFQTDFDISVDTFMLGDSAGVLYTDEPDKTGLQVELDIDLTDRLNPVVNTIKFVGELGDIDHALVTPPSIVIDAGLAFVTITPTGVGSFVETNGPAVAVGAGGMFNAGPDTSLNVVEGTIDVLIAPLLGPPIFSDSFDLSQNGASSSSITDGALSTISVLFDRTEGGLDFYDVEISTPLEDAESVFQIDLGSGEFADLSLTINGTLLGRGSFSTPTTIPEPSTLGLLVVAGSLAVRRVVRRRRA